MWGCEEYDDVLIHVFVHPSCSDFVCFLSVSALFLVGFLVPGRGRTCNCQEIDETLSVALRTRTVEGGMLTLYCF